MFKEGESMRRLKFPRNFAANSLCVRFYTYVCVYFCCVDRTYIIRNERGKRGMRGGKKAEGRERSERNGAGDNNHNNLVKRYKDISR